MNDNSCIDIDIVSSFMKDHGAIANNGIAFLCPFNWNAGNFLCSIESRNAAKTILEAYHGRVSPG